MNITNIEAPSMDLQYHFRNHLSDGFFEYENMFCAFQVCESQTDRFWIAYYMFNFILKNVENTYAIKQDKLKLLSFMVEQLTKEELVMITDDKIYLERENAYLGVSLAYEDFHDKFFHLRSKYIPTADFLSLSYEVSCEYDDFKDDYNKMIYMSFLLHPEYEYFIEEKIRSLSENEVVEIYNRLGRPELDYGVIALIFEFYAYAYDKGLRVKCERVSSKEIDAILYMDIEQTCSQYGADKFQEILSSFIENVIDDYTKDFDVVFFSKEQMLKNQKFEVTFDDLLYCFKPTITEIIDTAVCNTRQIEKPESSRKFDIEKTAELLRLIYMMLEHFPEIPYVVSESSSIQAFLDTENECAEILFIDDDSVDVLKSYEIPNMDKKEIEAAEDSTDKILLPALTPDEYKKAEGFDDMECEDEASPMTSSPESTDTKVSLIQTCIKTLNSECDDHIFIEEIILDTYEELMVKKSAVHFVESFANDIHMMLNNNAERGCERDNVYVLTRAVNILDEILNEKDGKYVLFKAGVDVGKL